jgi:hypothetical protein
LSITSEDGNAVSSEVTAAGGTISATGSDGTKYELAIPPNALDETTTITLTPAAASGTIFGETRTSALGVQFAPQGLFLWERATLTVTPAAKVDIPLAEQLFVHWEDGGKDLGVAPIDPGSKAMKVYVDHFSGVSIFDVKGLDAKLSTLDQWISDTQDEQFLSQMAVAAGLEREGSMAYQALHDQIVGELGQAYIDEALNPRIAEAKTSCARAKLAMTSAIAFSRDLGMLGEAKMAETWMQKAMGVFPDRATVCMKEEYEICRDNHVLDRILFARWAMYTEANRWGINLKDAVSQKLDDYVRGCMSFKVVLDGFGGFQVDGMYKMEQKVLADGVSVQIDGDVSNADWLLHRAWKIGPTIGPTVTLKSVNYTAESLDTCVGVSNIVSQDSTFTVTAFDIVPSPHAGIQDFIVKYTMTPNTSSFDWSVQGHAKTGGCEGPVATTPQADVNWFLCHIIITAQKNPGDAQHNYTLTNWSTETNDAGVRMIVFAYSLPQSGGLVYNDDIFKVTHDPAVVSAM